MAKKQNVLPEEAVKQPMPEFPYSRPTLRQALVQTILDQEILGVELSKRSGASASLISRYMKGHQGITDGNLSDLLNGLTHDQFRYFLSVLYGSDQILKELEAHRSDSSQNEARYAAFRVWFPSFLAECTSDQAMDLIVLIAESRQTKMQAASKKASDNEIDSS